MLPALREVQHLLFLCAVILPNLWAKYHTHINENSSVHPSMSCGFIDNVTLLPGTSAYRWMLHSLREIFVQHHCHCSTAPHMSLICFRKSNHTPASLNPAHTSRPFSIDLHTARQHLVIALFFPSSVWNAIPKDVSEYSRHADLHIAVTDSSGRCHHFDQDGLHVDVCWTECVPISVASWKISQANWNYLLTIFSDKTQWSSARYNVVHCNCFDFVLQFLRMAVRGNNVIDVGKQLLGSKLAFCREFLFPRLQKPLQFVSLCQAVAKHGYVVCRIPS